jgi:hypothetical protein
MPKVYISRGHVQNEGLGIEVFPGDEVPAALIKASPWLVEEGVVVEKGQFLADAEKVTAQEAPEAPLADAPDSGDLGDVVAAPAASEEP